MIPPPVASRREIGHRETRQQDNDADQRYTVEIAIGTPFTHAWP